MTEFGTVTIDTAVPGRTDHDIPNAYTVSPGTYEVEDIDGEDLLYLVVDEVPDVCVMVKASDLGMVPCVECDGRGEHHYRTGVDEFETDACEGCNAIGFVTEATAAEQQAYIDAMREREMEP